MEPAKIEMPPGKNDPVYHTAVTNHPFDVNRKFFEAAFKIGYPGEIIPVEDPEEIEKIGGTMKVMVDTTSTSLKLAQLLNQARKSRIFYLFHSVWQGDTDKVMEMIAKNEVSEDISKDLLSSAFLAAYNRRREMILRDVVDPRYDEDAEFFDHIRKSGSSDPDNIEPLTPLRPSDMNRFLVRVIEHATANDSNLQP